MSAPPTLPGLPVELLNHVFSYLELADMCNARLASGSTTRCVDVQPALTTAFAAELAAKSTQGHFGTFFRSHTMCWNGSETLENFALIMQPGSPALRLQNLIVAGRVPHLEVDEMYQSLEDERLIAPLLSRAFTNLLAGSPHACLESLTMATQDTRLHPPPDPGSFLGGKWRYANTDWRQVWNCAGETFKQVVQALAISKLPVYKLDIFAIKPGCSLAIDQIHAMLEDFDLASIMKGLRELSLSISHPVIGISRPNSPGDDDHDHDKVTVDTIAGFVLDLARLLELCQALKSLTLCWYNLNSRDTSPEKYRIFGHAASLEYPALHHVELGGIWCDEEGLLNFAQHNKQLRTLRLEEIHLCNGTFRDFFRYITTQMGLLESYELINLFENGEYPICFTVSGQPRMQTSRRNGPHELKRVAAEVRKPLAYSAQKGYMLGSSAKIRWYDGRRDRFGPPSRSQGA